MADFAYNYIAPVGEHGRHIWTLKGPKGAIHIWAMENSEEWVAIFGDRFSGGVERHSPTPVYSFDTAPHQEHCWLLEGPCYHDGTSLYFSENIAPMLPRKPLFSDGVVEYINSVMRDLYASNFGETPA